MLAVWTNQLECTRLLLRYNASQDPVDKNGWDATMHCWPEARIGQDSRLGHLRLLNEDAVLNATFTNSANWTHIQRASAYGTADEVRALVRHGALPDHSTAPLGWNAIQHSTYFGNIATFEALLLLTPNAEHAVDIRGWSLLHLAAEGAGFEMVQRLLRLGVDARRRSKPSVERIERFELQNRACLASDVSLVYHGPGQVTELFESCEDVEAQVDGDAKAAAVDHSQASTQRCEEQFEAVFAVKSLVAWFILMIVVRLFIYIRYQR